MDAVPTDVLIAGGGLAAQRVAETLRARGFDGPVRLVGAEPERPYDRPPLSKAFLSGEVDDLAFRPATWYAEQDVDLELGVAAAGVDGRRLRLADGRSLPFGELVVATGGRARPLPGGALTLRSAGDARRLRDALAPGARIAVVGAGFIGMEVAATARALGCEVTIVEALAAPMRRVLPPVLGHWFAGIHRRAGVDVQLGVAPDLRALAASHDVVLAAIGSEPDAAWLGFPGGVPVDALGRTPLPHVWAAGDCALSPGRCDHWELAARQGAGVARALLGLPVAEPGPASAWTDQYGVRVQVLGALAHADDVAIDGDLDAMDFTAVARLGGRVCGVLLAGRPRELASWRRRLATADDHEKRSAA